LPEFGEEVAEGVGLGEVFGVSVVGVVVLGEDFGGGEGGIVGVGAEEDAGVFLDGFVAVVGVGVAEVLDEVGVGELGVLGKEVIGEFAPAAEGGGVIDRLDRSIGVAEVEMDEPVGCGVAEVGVVGEDGLAFGGRAGSVG